MLSNSFTSLHDSHFVLYQVQTKHPDSGRWVDWESAWNFLFIPRIPVKYANESDARNGKEQEPFRSFSACGRCWQETGIKGVFDRDQAYRLVDVLLEYNPNATLRVVKVEVRHKVTLEGEYAGNVKVLP
jgi:hypothetical protein